MAALSEWRIEPGAAGGGIALARSEHGGTVGLRLHQQTGESRRRHTRGY